MLYRRCFLLVLTLVIWLLGVPQAQAQVLDWGEVQLNSQQDGPLFLTSSRITADTVINGDVYLIAEEIELRGTIKGDVFCLAQKVTINGHVEGDIRMLASDVEINGTCSGGVTALGDSLWFWQEASCREVFLAVGSAQLNGSIDGRLKGQADTMYINGPIKGKVDLRVNQQLSLGPRAELQGGLTYQSPNQFKQETGAVINGTPEYKSIPAPAKQGINLTAVFFSWVSSLIIWWLAGVLRPTIWQQWSLSLAERPWISLFLGGLAMLALPPLIMLLIFSMVGIPAALMLGIMAVIIGYLGRIVVAVGFSIYMVRNARIKPGIAIMIALIPLILLTYLPGVGFMFVLTYGCLGLGSLLYTLRFRRQGPGFDQVV